MKRLLTITVLAVLALFTLTACSSKPQAPPKPPEVEKFVVPEKWLRLDQYPILPAKLAMDDATLASLGLRRAKLDRPTLFFNHYRELGRNRKGGWRHEVLPAETGVAVDASGRPWYKLDCSNRLYAPVEREAVETLPPSPPKDGDNNGGDGSKWIPLSLLALLIAALVGLILWLRRRSNGGGSEYDPASRARDDKTNVAAATATRRYWTPTGRKVAVMDERITGIEYDLAGIRKELARMNEPAKPTAEPAAPLANEAAKPVPAAAPKLTLAEAQDLCLKHIALEHKGIRALYKRWDSDKISDEKFIAGVEAILAD